MDSDYVRDEILKTIFFLSFADNLHFRLAEDQKVKKHFFYRKSTKTNKKRPWKNSNTIVFLFHCLRDGGSEQTKNQQDYVSRVVIGRESEIKK